MAEKNRRKYPVGIQSFERIRRSGCMYVDKTALIYKLVKGEAPCFLSRPRRFGKSLLISTLEALFEGRRELFEEMTLKDGTVQPQLFIATTDWEWQSRPVFRFDFSAGDMTSIKQLDVYIDQVLGSYEEQYGITPKVADSNIRFAQLLRVSHEQTGQRAVVLVDEYDNFILHSLGNEELTTLARQRFQNLFSPLKSEDSHLRFVFITGISKFSQMGVFSKLNQLQNISMTAQYEAICGITEEELTTQLRPDIEQIAEAQGLTCDEQLCELKQMYDGYHFSEKMTDMYNPFSLINAFELQKLANYWFSSGTPGALIQLLRQLPAVNINDLEEIHCEASAFDRPFYDYSAMLPVLYQSGYLTIKDYDRELDDYTLGFPNLEVRRGFADCLFQHVTGRLGDDFEKNALLRSFKIFRRDDALPAFIDALKTFFAGVPYQLTDNSERHYHALLYTLFMSFGADVVAEEPSAGGRADLTLRMPRHIYVMELKHDHTAGEAIGQIRQRGYALKYRQDGRPVTLVGIAFSSSEHNIAEWRSEDL